MSLLDASKGRLTNAPPAGFSKDFGESQKLVPGVFFLLGLSRAARGIIAMPHSAGFDVDKAGIAFGIRAMAAVVLGRMTSEVIVPGTARPH